MAAPLQFTIVDAQMRVRTDTFTDQDSAIAAGTAALLLSDDMAWGVVQVLPGRAIGSDNYDGLTANCSFPNGFFYPPLDQVVPTNFDRSFFPTPSRFVKTGEIRYVGGGTVTFFPIAPPDGQKRADS